MRKLLIPFLLLLLFAAPSLATAHGGGDEVTALAKQPARVLVQQAHALLVSGKAGDAVEMRLDAAALSVDKRGVDAAILEKGHEAFESGRIPLAISQLESSMGGTAIHEESRVFEPAYGGQELGGSIAAAVIALLAALGLLRARSHGRRQPQSPAS